MSDLRVLIIEDGENWQDELSQLLRSLGGQTTVEVAPNYNSALHHLTNYTYDLITVDLALAGEPDETQTSDPFEGMSLLRQLRANQRNSGCSLIVLTAYPTTARTRQALRDYAAYDFIEKSEFDSHAFIETVRAALFDARLKQALAKASERYYLTIKLNQTSLVSSELVGPDRRANYTVERFADFDVADLERRADNLNLLLLQQGFDGWRTEARAVGSAMYQILANERRIVGDLVAARALADRFSQLWIQLSGPGVTLGFPFELLRDGDDYLAFDHIMTRQLVQTGANFTRKPEPFYLFLDNLRQSGQALRILIVGANSDGHIPNAEREAEVLASAIQANLQQVGIVHEITLLTGAQATYEHVTRALQAGEHHIFHYAGHGRYDDTLPEISGLMLLDDANRRTLTASDLNILVRQTDLRMVYLSCCLGARSGAQLGRGDFHGTLEALAKADVPIVLGHRWVVHDEAAMRMSLSFYQTLWRTLSPGEALLQARRSAAISTHSRDDATWASPVLLMQTV